MGDTNNNVENQGANNTSSNNTSNASIDYQKLEDIVNKGVARKEQAILKSYFEQNGLSEEEVANAIESYKSNKKTEETKNTKEFEDLTNNYANLQKQFNTEKLNNQITLSLMKKGLSEEQVPFILKMVEVEGILNDKGEINKDKMNENIENVFKAFPTLIKKEENKNFVQIGTQNNSSQYEESSDALLRKAFGLKEK